MKLNLVKPTQKSAKEIAQSIKDKTWDKFLTLNLDNFLDEIKPNEYVLNTKRQIQVKPENIDYDFVQTLKSIKENSSKKEWEENVDRPVVLVFSKPTKWNGEICHGEYLIGGTHTTCAEGQTGVDKLEFYCVDFENDLNGDVSLIRRFGNLLNQQNVIVQGLSDDAIKLEYHQYLDSRLKEGLDLIPTKEEKQTWVEDYPQITIRTLGQWDSYHEQGARRKPIKVYNDALKQSSLDVLKAGLEGQGYFYVKPHQITDWNNSALGMVMRGIYEKKQSKICLSLYCTTQEQADKLKDGWDKDIENFYNIIAKGQKKKVEIKVVHLPNE